MKPSSNGGKADSRAFVALGSNLGHSIRILREAAAALRKYSPGGSSSSSSLWSSAPVDCPPGSPAFVNAVVAFHPCADETPETLLLRLLALERRFGRPPKQVHNEPRPLDLDLILFGNEVRASEGLILPHPRAHLRRFVLQPMAEIAPALQIPGLSATVGELLAALPPDPSMRQLGTLADDDDAAAVPE